MTYCNLGEVDLPEPTPDSVAVAVVVAVLIMVAVPTSGAELQFEVLYRLLDSSSHPVSRFQPSNFFYVYNIGVHIIAITCQKRLQRVVHAANFLSFSVCPVSLVVV